MSVQSKEYAAQLKHDQCIRRDQLRVEKIAYMQRLVDEAHNSGISHETMGDIRTRALEQARHVN